MMIRVTQFIVYNAELLMTIQFSIVSIVYLISTNNMLFIDIAYVLILYILFFRHKKYRKLFR